MLGGDKLEVDRMNNGPNLPRALAGREKIILDLVHNHRDRISIDQAQIGEEYRHEDGAPDNLIKGHFHGNLLGFRTFDLLVQPVVEEMSGRSMIQETKGRKSNEALHVKGATTNENL